jgi:predicted nucleic acid-binding Zn finger protein
VIFIHASPVFTNLYVTSPAVEVHVKVLDLAELAKHVLNILLARFFVYVGGDNDPALNAADGSCVFGCACVQTRGRLDVLVVDW